MTWMIKVEMKKMIIRKNNNQISNNYKNFSTYKINNNNWMIKITNNFLRKMLNKPLIIIKLKKSLNHKKRLKCKTITK